MPPAPSHAWRSELTLPATRWLKSCTRQTGVIMASLTRFDFGRAPDDYLSTPRRHPRRNDKNQTHSCRMTSSRDFNRIATAPLDSSCQFCRRDSYKSPSESLLKLPAILIVAIYHPSLYMSSIFSRIFRGAQEAVSGAPTSAMIVPEGAEKATVAAGCFWGVEKMYRKEFTEAKGLLDARVGYIGGHMDNPTYRDVCDTDTGHAEALQVIFDPKVLPYRSLVEFFYKMHDPTTLNRQGADHGTQYRSAIFYHSPEQEKIAREVTEKANAQWWHGKIVTKIVPAGEWWDAEKYHQQYLEKTPRGYECPMHHKRKVADLI